MFLFQNSILLAESMENEENIEVKKLRKKLSWLHFAATHKLTSYIN